MTSGFGKIYLYITIENHVMISSSFKGWKIVHNFSDNDPYSDEIIRIICAFALRSAFDESGTEIIEAIADYAVKKNDSVKLKYVSLYFNEVFSTYEPDTQEKMLSRYMGMHKTVNDTCKGVLINALYSIAKSIRGQYIATGDIQYFKHYRTVADFLYEIYGDNVSSEMFFYPESKPPCGFEHMRTLLRYDMKHYDFKPSCFHWDFFAEDSASATLDRDLVSLLYGQSSKDVRESAVKMLIHKNGGNEVIKLLTASCKDHNEDRYCGVCDLIVPLVIDCDAFTKDWLEIQELPLYENERWHKARKMLDQLSQFGIKLNHNSIKAKLYTGLPSDDSEKAKIVKKMANEISAENAGVAFSVLEGEARFDCVLYIEHIDDLHKDYNKNGGFYKYAITVYNSVKGREIIQDILVERLLFWSRLHEPKKDEMLFFDLMLAIAIIKDCDRGMKDVGWTYREFLTHNGIITDKEDGFTRKHCVEIAKKILKESPHNSHASIHRKIKESFEFRVGNFKKK